MGIPLILISEVFEGPLYWRSLDRVVWRRYREVVDSSYLYVYKNPNKWTAKIELLQCTSRIYDAYELGCQKFAFLIPR